MPLTGKDIRELAEKYAASSKASKHTKARRGKRPIRVETLLKKSSQSGADLRLPLMGGTKFPTQDSLSKSKKLLKEHQDNSRFGGATQNIKSTVPNYDARIDVMPKVGSPMNIDPLIAYLKKQAGEWPGKVADWPKGDRKIEKTELVDSSSISATPEGKPEKAEVDEDPTVANSSFPDKEGVSDWKGYMSKMFNNRPKKKHLDKDHPPKVGTVDKVARS